MSQQTLKKELIASYDIDDINWGKNAKAIVNKFWSELPPSKSKNDPLRLGSKSVFLCRLKEALIETKVQPLEVDGYPEFNALSTSEQRKFQQRARNSNDNKWVHKLDVIPENIQMLCLSETEAKQLEAQRSKVANDKLKSPPLVVDGDQLIQTLLPLLGDTSSNVLAGVVPALLLATGRRTIEILKTADFQITPEMSADGYECVFSGQAKEGINELGPYTIPLLAPFWLVRQALDRVRASIDTTKMPEIDVNSLTASSLNKYSKKLTGLNPHMFRSVYALMCFELNKTKSSMIGYVATILGHANPQNAMFYQRILIQKFTGPYVPVKPATATPVSVAPTTGWVFHSRPEQKRVEAIKALMLHKIKVTDIAVHSWDGGTMAVIRRVIDNNQAIIDAYNATL